MSDLKWPNFQKFEELNYILSIVEANSVNFKRIQHNPDVPTQIYFWELGCAEANQIVAQVIRFRLTNLFGQ